MASNDAKRAADKAIDIERSVATHERRMAQAGNHNVHSSGSAVGPAESEPSTQPEITANSRTQSREQGHDTLSALIEMTDQQRRLLDLDADFQTFLRSRSLVLRTAVMHTAAAARGEVLDFTPTRPAEVEAAIREALVRQGDSTNPSPTVRGPIFNPEAQEWRPSVARVAEAAHGAHGRSASGQQSFHNRSASGQQSLHSRSTSGQQGGRSRATSGQQGAQGGAVGSPAAGFNPEAKEWHPPGQ